MHHMQRMEGVRVRILMEIIRGALLYFAYLRGGGGCGLSGGGLRGGGWLDGQLWRALRRRWAKGSAAAGLVAEVSHAR